jgi:hypothetical protein
VVPIQHRARWAPAVDRVLRDSYASLKRLILQWKNQLATKRMSNPRLARGFNKRACQGIRPFSRSFGPRTKVAISLIPRT